MGNQCLCCGIFGSDNVSLEYDHINCATKTENLSHINVDSEEFNVELRQVRVLCYRCHMWRSGAQKIAKSKLFNELDADEKELYISQAKEDVSVSANIAKLPSRAV